MNKIALGILALLVLAGSATAIAETYNPYGLFIGYGQMSFNTYIWQDNSFAEANLGNATYYAPLAPGDNGTYTLDYANGTIVSGILPTEN